MSQKTESSCNGRYFTQTLIATHLQALLMISQNIFYHHAQCLMKLCPSVIGIMPTAALVDHPKHIVDHIQGPGANNTSATTNTA